MEEAESPSITPRIVAAKAGESGVRVTYSAPGADGSKWPVLSISVRRPEVVLPARSRYVRRLKEEGTVLVPIELEANQELIVFGSTFYENGKRVHLEEMHLRSPADLPVRAHKPNLRAARYYCKINREAGALPPGPCPYTG